MHINDIGGRDSELEPEVMKLTEENIENYLGKIVNLSECDLDVYSNGQRFSIYVYDGKNTKQNLCISKLSYNTLYDNDGDKGFGWASDMQIDSTFDFEDNDVKLQFPYRPGVYIACFAQHCAKWLGEPDLFEGLMY